jgi:hypothetical protein
MDVRLNITSIGLFDAHEEVFLQHIAIRVTLTVASRAGRRQPLWWTLSRPWEHVPTRREWLD